MSKPNVLATVDAPAASLAVASAPTGPAPVRYEDLRLMVESFAKSGLFKGVQDFNKAITVALVGQELGIGPATSIMGIHIIEGKPSLSANLMASQLKRTGKYNFRVKVNTSEICTIAFYELWGGKWEEIGVSEFTIDEAKVAGLAGKDVWKKYPKAMLFARALSQGVRTFAPDAFGGSPVYYEGEIEESMTVKEAEYREVPAAPKAKIASLEWVASLISAEHPEKPKQMNAYKDYQAWCKGRELSPSAFAEEAQSVGCRTMAELYAYGEDGTRPAEEEPDMFAED